jgi:hypothetical protein
MLMLPMISLLPKESIQVLTKKFDPAFETLNQAEVQAVVTAELEGAVTNQRMQEICDRLKSLRIQPTWPDMGNLTLTQVSQLVLKA